MLLTGSQDPSGIAWEQVRSAGPQALPDLGTQILPFNGGGGVGGSVCSVVSEAPAGGKGEHQLPLPLPRGAPRGSQEHTMEGGHPEGPWEPAVAPTGQETQPRETQLRKGRAETLHCLQVQGFLIPL